jgi:nucleoside-diphosphate-sugar epimerase
MSESSPIHTEADLDEVMTCPRPVLVESIRELRSPLVILGGGGKMGPTLARLARRAADAAGMKLDIVSVSRFSNASARAWLEEHGIRTLSLDLLEQSAYAQLPDSSNVLYLIGQKFGTTDHPGATWATNTLPPAYTCQRYPQARITALSSGNVYPLTPTTGSGSQEGDPLEPLGEYANSCVARERIFDYFSNKNGTPVALIRLSYAVDLRYGVLFDIASRVFSGQPVDLNTAYFNCIWQGDANEAILRSLVLAASPTYSVNLTGVKWLSVRETAEKFGKWMEKPVCFTGSETGSAYLSNPAQMVHDFGVPATSLETVMRWTADWVMVGGRSLNKPTHFETRNGKY